MSPMSVVYGHGCYPTSPNQNTYTNYLYPKFCYSLATFDQVFPSLLTPTSIMSRLIWIASNSSFSWKKIVGVLDVFEDQDRFTLALPSQTCFPDSLWQYISLLRSILMFSQPHALHKNAKYKQSALNGPQVSTSKTIHCCLPPFHH